MLPPPTNPYHTWTHTHTALAQYREYAPDSSLSSPLIVWSDLLPSSTLSAARFTAMGSFCTKFRWPSSTRTTSSLWTCHWPQLQVRHLGAPPSPEPSTKGQWQDQASDEGGAHGVPLIPPCCLFLRTSPTALQGASQRPQPQHPPAAASGVPRRTFPGHGAGTAALDP